MAWMRGCAAALAACVLIGGATACGSSEAQERTGGARSSPVGRLLPDTDGEGRRYREIDEKGAPGVGIVVRPDTAGGWDVRLTVTNFRFSRAGTDPTAEPGRGVAVLRLDGRDVARLRGPEHRLPEGRLSRGTHQLTVRLYADDGTVWAVNGEPVESTADVTASEDEPAADASPTAHPLR
ncbi:hypothetical protein [Streptomyces cavernae]|uniref:hypothetical protein n=1 Tax=Streptomyces cavernae TaxID=2259034 RepID=UPI000FEB8B19|nr:hypothetical protein [Streptomyces cavernae]